MGGFGVIYELADLAIKDCLATLTGGNDHTCSFPLDGVRSWYIAWVTV